MKHPVQKPYTDEQGVYRFTENKLVRWLVDQLPSGLNTLAQHGLSGGMEDDYDQILQLIGYSLSNVPFNGQDGEIIRDTACKMLEEGKSQSEAENEVLNKLENKL